MRPFFSDLVTCIGEYKIIARKNNWKILSMIDLILHIDQIICVLILNLDEGMGPTRSMTHYINLVWTNMRVLLDCSRVFLPKQQILFTFLSHPPSFI